MPNNPVVAGLSLHGPFLQIRDWLDFRRYYPQQAERACSSMRCCANMDPRRANRWRHPEARLYGEYLWGYVTAINRAPFDPQFNGTNATGIWCAGWRAGHAGSMSGGRSALRQAFPTGSASRAWLRE